MALKDNIKKATIFFILLIWILITQSFQWFTLNRVRITQPDKKDCFPDQSCYFAPQPLEFIQMHARCDSAWYIDIALEGYSFSQDRQSNVNFFPLYPLCMRSLSKIIRPFTFYLPKFEQYIIAGVIISGTSLLLGLMILYRLFQLDVDHKTALVATLFLLSFPTSFFFTAVYTESLFLILSALMFYLARKGKFILSGVTGFFAALTRPVGFLLFLPLAIELYSHFKKQKKSPSVLSFFPPLLPILGLLTFMIFLYIKFKNPLLFLEAAKYWGRGFGSVRFPLIMLTSLINNLNYELNFTPASLMNIILEIGFLIFGVVTSFFAFKKERLSYAIWSLLSVLFPLTSGALVSQGRYTLVLFPLFLTLARLAREKIILFYFYITISSLLGGMLIVLFVNGHWAG